MTRILKVRFSTLLLSAFALVVSVANAALADAPEFEAKGNSGKIYKSAELLGKPVVLEWFNAGCPFVKRLYDKGEMQRLQNEYQKKGFVWLTVNSTESSHKDFLNGEQSKATLEKWKSAPTDYVADADGKLGHLFQAKTTPHMFIIGAKGAFMYQGAFDNYPEAEDEPEKIVPYFENALKEVADGKPVTLAETKPYGCSVKYKE